VSVKLYLQIPPIPFFSKEEEDYWVEQYSINGFDHSESPPFLKGGILTCAAALHFYTAEVRVFALVLGVPFSILFHRINLLPGTLHMIKATTPFPSPF
jgi:hypothetical protein